MCCCRKKKREKKKKKGEHHAKSFPSVRLSVVVVVVVCVTAHLALSFSLKELILLPPPLGAKASPLKLKLLPRTSEEMML